jgi:hypothetical protein
MKWYLGNGFTKIASLGGNGQDILCLEEKHEENSILRMYVSKKFMKARHLEVMAEANRFPGLSRQPKWRDKPARRSRWRDKIAAPPMRARQGLTRPGQTSLVSMAGWRDSVTPT